MFRLDYEKFDRMELIDLEMLALDWGIAINEFKKYNFYRTAECLRNNLNSLANYLELRRMYGER